MNEVAILLYGALAIVLSFAFAYAAGSHWGMALSVLAACLTYVAQVVTYFAYAKTAAFNALWFAVMATVAASVLLSTATGA